jgi:hypothetical protein
MIYIRKLGNMDLWIYQRWDHTRGGITQTQTPGYTGGKIRCYTNTDHWIYQRWDQVLDKHGPWIYQRWDQVLHKHGPLDIPEVGSSV